MNGKRVMLLLTLLGVSSQYALAQDYPARTIRVVVPTSPGAASDILARIMAQKLGEALGQQVVVDNRSGASAVIGTDLVAKSAPDGYTLLFTPAAVAINPSMFSKLPYDTMRDLAPISQIAEAPHLLMVHPSVPAKSVKELIALAKAKPGSLTIASPGMGASPHLSGELFKIMAGVNMLQVSYKGGGLALIGVLSGEVGVMFPTPTSAMRHIKSGRLRALGSTGKKRIQVLNELPTIAEAGLPGYETMQWWGVVAPAGTPRPIIDRLYQEISRAMRAPDLKERLMADGTDAVGSTPEEFANYIKSENGKWAKVIKESGIKPQ